jgi:hypothetical protein
VGYRNGKHHLNVATPEHINFWSNTMNYANLVAGIAALHHINQEPQITLIKASVNRSRIRHLVLRLRLRLRRNTVLRKLKSPSNQ